MGNPGKILRVYGRATGEWAGGGILLDQGIHMVDLFLFFAGNFTEVKSFVTTSFWNIPLEDNAFALLRNSQNQVAMIHASSTHWKNKYSFEICLENGFIVIRGDLSPTGDYGPTEKLIVSPRQLEDKRNTPGASAELVTHFKTDTAWVHEVEAFVDRIHGGTTTQNGTSGDTLKAMKLVDRIYHKDTSWWNRWNLSAAQ